MASIQARISRGKKYWSIVESRRINGKPRTVILEYLGSADRLLERLKSEGSLSLKSYSHGATRALLDVAEELNIVNTINDHIPEKKSGSKQVRNGLSVGATFLLAAIGRACRPTSKMGWFDWSKETSLGYCLRSSFKGIDSQHFWDQMDALPIKSISKIEEALVTTAIKCYELTPDCLFYDTTNFFTFIDSTNEYCELPKRGKNKQKRYDLRQIGMALLVTRDEQFPLFHTVYEGNKADSNVFKDELTPMLKRLNKVISEVSSVTLVFDKGNNSKENFLSLDNSKNCFYVAGLVATHFKALLNEANKNFSPTIIEGKSIPVYRTKKEIWGQERTCVVTVSEKLKAGQIRGIYQHLDKKYQALYELKVQIEKEKSRTKLSETKLNTRLKKIINGQFIENVLTYEIIKLDDAGNFTFKYCFDDSGFEKLKKEVLGKQILVSNRHEWSSEEIINAYHGQCKVEYAFRTLKNPYHLAIRPQYHWTDQKIRVHFLICIIAYMLTIAVYSKVRKKTKYKSNIQTLMNDLDRIRLTCIARNSGSKKVSYQLETVPTELRSICKTLEISNDSIRSPLSSLFSVTTR